MSRGGDACARSSDTTYPFCLLLLKPSHIPIINPDHALIAFSPSSSTSASVAFPMLCYGLSCRKGANRGRLCVTSFLNGEEAGAEPAQGRSDTETGTNVRNHGSASFSVLFPIEYRSPPRRRRRRWRWFRGEGTGPMDESLYIPNNFVPLSGERRRTPRVRDRAGPTCHSGLVAVGRPTGVLYGFPPIRPAAAYTPSAR